MWKKKVQQLSKLIVLGRDGALNKLVIDQEHGTIDSPLHPDQVEIVKGVPLALKELCGLGYYLVIAANQPAAKKGKTTEENLFRTHERVVTLAESAGGKIAKSYIA